FVRVERLGTVIDRVEVKVVADGDGEEPARPRAERLDRFRTAGLGFDRAERIGPGRIRVWLRIGFRRTQRWPDVVLRGRHQAGPGRLFERPLGHLHRPLRRRLLLLLGHHLLDRALLALVFLLLLFLLLLFLLLVFLGWVLLLGLLVLLGVGRRGRGVVWWVRN